MDLSLPGCFAMTETGHGSDVQSVHTTATYDAGHRRVRRRHPDRVGAQGLHRQRRPRRADGGGVRAALHAPSSQPPNATACTPSSSRCATTTARSCPASRSPTTGTRRGSTASTTAGWRSAACACRARTCSTATAPSPRTARTRARSRARTAASSPCSARSCAAASASRAARWAPRRWPRPSPCATARRGASSPRRAARRRSPSSTTWPTSASCCPASRAPTRCGSRRTSSSRCSTTSRPPGRRAGTSTRSVSASSSRAPRARRRSRPGTPRPPSRPAARRAAGRATCRRTGSAQLRADTDVFTTFEGDNTVLLQLVAKGLISGYADDFGNLDTLGTVRFVADQVLDTVAERTSLRQLAERLRAVAPGRDEDDVLDRSWQVKLLDDREEHTLDGLVRRLRPARDKSLSAERAVRDLQQRAGPPPARRAQPPRRPGARRLRARPRRRRRPVRAGPAGQGLRPLRPVGHRGGQGLVPRARAHLGRAGRRP